MSQLASDVAVDPIAAARQRVFGARAAIARSRARVFGGERDAGGPAVDLPQLITGMERLSLSAPADPPDAAGVDDQVPSADDAYSALGRRRMLPGQDRPGEPPGRLGVAIFGDPGEQIDDAFARFARKQHRERMVAHGQKYTPEQLAAALAEMPLPPEAIPGVRPSRSEDDARQYLAERELFPNGVIMGRERPGLEQVPSEVADAVRRALLRLAKTATVTAPGAQEALGEALADIPAPETAGGRILGGAAQGIIENAPAMLAGPLAGMFRAAPAVVRAIQAMSAPVGAAGMAVAGTGAELDAGQTDAPTIVGNALIDGLANFVGLRTAHRFSEDAARQVGRAVITGNPAEVGKTLVPLFGAGVATGVQGAAAEFGRQMLQTGLGKQSLEDAFANFFFQGPEAFATAGLMGAGMTATAAAARAPRAVQAARVAEGRVAAAEYAAAMRGEDGPLIRRNVELEGPGTARAAEPSGARQEEGKALLNPQSGQDTSIPPAPHDPPELGAPRAPQSERPQVGAKPLPGAAVWQGGRITASIDEIPAGVAARAFSNTSHVPDQRGEQYRRMYVEAFDSVAEPLRKMATTPEQAAALEQELATFRDRLRSRFMAFLEAHTRVASPMITGPARFPVAANAKRIASADRRRAEIGELQTAARNAIVRKLFPQAAASVSSDLADAEVILRRQAAEGRRLQEAMIAANQMLRKGGTHDERAAALRALGFGDQVIDSVLRLDHAGRVTGFPHYRLKNNLANVKRIEGRIAELARRDASTPRTAAFDGGAVVENPTENRVQIAFEKKPDGATLERLRRAGFRWSHSRGVWQRLRNEAGWKAALQLTGAKQAAPNAEVGRPASATVPGDRAGTPAADRTPAPESLGQRLQRMGRELMQGGDIPRGRNVGATRLHRDLAGVALIAAGRIVETGATFAQAAKDLGGKVAATVRELLPNARERDVAALTGEVRRLLRRSAGPGGVFDEARFEREAGAFLDRHGHGEAVRGVKTAVRDTTGLNDRSEPVSERQALAAGLRKAESAAAAAYRAGRAETIREFDARIESVRATLRGRAQSADAVRQAVREAVERYVPTDRQHAFTAALAGAKTPRDYWRVLDRARREAIDATVRQASKSAAMAVHKGETTKMLAEYRAEIQALRGELETLTRELERVEEAGARTRLAEELNAVEEAAHNVIASNRHEQEVMVLNKVYTAEQVRHGVMIAAGKKRQLAGDGVDPVGGFTRRRDVDLMSMDTLGRDLGDDTFHKLMTEDLWNHETAKHAIDLAGREALTKALRDNGFKPGSAEVQAWSDAVLGKPGRAKRTTIKLAGGRDLSITPAEHMALYGTLTDGGAGPQIASGDAPIRFAREQKTGPAIRLGPGDARRIIDALDPRQRAIVDAAKAFIEQRVRPGVFAAFRDMKGYDLVPVENYYRTRRDMSRAGQEPEIVRQRLKRAVALLAEKPESVRAHVRQSLENLGFMKPREAARHPFLIGDFFSDYQAMVYDGSTVAEMTRPVRQLESITGHGDVRAALVKVYGSRITRHMDRFTQDAKMLFREPRTTMEKAHALLTRHLARAVLTLSPSAMAKNVGGVFKILDQVPTADAVKGLARMYGDDVTRILDTDPFFRERYDGAAYRRVSPVLGERLPLAGDTSVGEALDRAWRVWRPGKAYGAVGDLIDRLPMYDAADAFPVRAAIAAKFVEAERRGIPAAERDAWVAREAQYVVRRTQNTASPLDMSNFAAEHRAGGAIATPVTMFKSDSFKAWNMLRAAAAEGPRQFMRSAVAVGLNAAWAAAVTTSLSMPVLRAVRGTQEEENERGQLETFVRAFSKNVAAMIPGVEELAADPAWLLRDAAAGRGVRSDAASRSLQGPVFGMLHEAITGAWEAADAFTRGDGASDPKLTRGGVKLLRAIGRALGIPADPLVDLWTKWQRAGPGN